MTDTGVVDPIRPPAFATRAWDRTPPLARLYLGLALVSWLLTVVPYLGQVDLLSLPLLAVAAPLAQAAFVALPAALLLRRPDAATAAPLLFRGAVALALVTFVTPFVNELPAAAGLAEPEATGVAWILAFLVAIASALPILAVGVGLRRLRGGPPSPPMQALGLVAALATVGLPIATTMGDLTFDVTPYVPAGWGPFLSPMALVGPLLAPLAQAALLYVVVLALDDGARPLPARRLAAAAVALRVLLPLAIVGLQLLAGASSGAAGAAALVLSLAAGPWPTIALVVAFGLGLADPADPEPGRGRRGATPAELRARTRS